MALYIDADNISYKQINNIMNNVNSDLYIKKIYSDWSKSEMKNWSKLLDKYGLEPIQCFRIGKKQSTDIKLITDVISDVHTFKHINNIYLVTSDVDFTFLCQNIKKLGKKIHLMFTQDTHLKNYVDSYVNLSDDLINYIEEIINNINSKVISVKKLLYKLKQTFNIEIEYNYIIKYIQEYEDFIVTKKKKTEYIIDISEIKNISDNDFYMNEEFYNQKFKNILNIIKFNDLIKII